MSALAKLTKELKALANKQKALESQKYFKTGKGEYGEGDIMMGISVPARRIVAKKYWKEITLDDIDTLLASKLHEHRSIALEMLVYQYEAKPSKKIVDFYLAHTKRINNWDLVDASCREIIGAYCFEKNNIAIMRKLVTSKDLWEKRIAMVATYYFIVRGNFAPTIEMAKALMDDPHDLIHKSIGWMLREMGKRDRKALKEFLAKNIQKMPRTALRYSIEHFTPAERKLYLSY